MPLTRAKLSPGSTVFLPAVTATGTVGLNPASGTVNIGTATPVQNTTRVEVGSTEVGASGKVDFNLLLAEQVTVRPLAAGGAINLDIANNANVTYFTQNSTSNWVLNIRGNANLSYNSITDVNQSVTVVFAATNGSTAFLQSGLQIDGIGQGIRWQGGSAPTTGNANSIDIYSFTIIKLAGLPFPAYTVLGSLTRFA